MKHFKITFEPDNIQVSIHEGATLVDAAGLANITLNTSCGGIGKCGKCAVILQPQKKKVLACIYEVHSDLTVTVPDQAHFSRNQILSHGLDRKIDRDNELPGHIENPFGLAIDIGTTTLVAKLIDLKTGKSVAVASDLNPQTSYGDDVVSRIAFAADKANRTILHDLIIETLNRLTESLCEKAKITPTQIFRASVVANTTMNHLFLDLPVESLGTAPYHAYSLDSADILAKELGLNIHPDANIHTLANIAGFVGSDTTAVALATDLDSVAETILIIDIGTNGELLLTHKNKIFAASCAAGPALEGARITHGSRAQDSAIESVVINEDDIDLDVIGSVEPRSICGSGLIDAVAVMLELGILESTGRFTDRSNLNLPPKILDRIITEDGKPAFLLNENPRIFLSQDDIRQFQLAKAAIAAGIKLLQNHIGITIDQIDSILLAGAFGNYIKKQSAIKVGLIPETELKKIKFIGNAATTGAEMVLLSRSYAEKAKQLACSITYIEIANQPRFTEIYTDSMFF